MAGVAERRVSGVAEPRWGLTAVLWVMLVASLAGLAPLFQGTSWWFLVALVSALVLAVSALLRSRGAFALVACFGGAVVGGMASCLAVSGGTAVLGVIPTAATIQRASFLASDVRETIIGGQAPVPVDDAVRGLLVVAVAAAAVLVDLAAHAGRFPIITAAIPGVVLLVPTLVPDARPSWLWVAVTLLAFVAVLVVSSGARPTGSALVGGVSAIAVAAIVTAVLPAWAVSPLDRLGTTTGIATGVNPAIDLGANLRRGAPVDVLSYSTTSSTGEYLKLVDLVDFSGRSWKPAAVTLDGSHTVDHLPDAPGIADTTRRHRVVTSVSVSLLRSPYLPIPVPATTISGIGSAWKYVDESGVTVRTATEGSQGLDYTVVSNPIDPTRSQIVASFGETPDDLSAYTSVAGVPKSIGALAARVTNGSANPFDAAVDLQNYFRDGSFTYSEDTPVRDGYDGTGLQEVETFLQRKSGYCVHFASAMAVMARTLGIPSRIAVGFMPGEETGAGREYTYQVTSNDLHTWPELYFQGLGWVPFEPTVGQGTTAGFIQQTHVDATPPPAAPATTLPTESTAPTTVPAPTPSAKPTAGSDTAAADTGVTASAPWRPAGVGTGILVLLLLAAAPFTLRTRRRRRRLRADPSGIALEAWREVLDTARDLGIDVSAGATPLASASALAAALAAALARRPPPEDARGGPAADPHDPLIALQSLADAVEQERFAPPTRTGGAGRSTSSVGVALAPPRLAPLSSAAVPSAAIDVIAGLRRAVGLPRRIVAAVAPASLLRSTRPNVGR